MAVQHADIPSPFYRVSLKALIFDDKQRLLVVRPGDNKPWELPGGGWEHGESMQHCLRREIMEELSVIVEHIDFGTMYPYSAHSQWGYEALKLAIPVQITGDEDIVPSDGMSAVRYVTQHELAALEMNDDEAGIKQHIARIWPADPRRA